MKMKPNQITLIILLSFIIILIIYLFYKKNKCYNKEGFITKLYRPYFRSLKRGFNKYVNYYLNY